MSGVVQPDWERLDESPAATAQMLTWHAPRSVEVLLAAERERITQAIKADTYDEVARYIGFNDPTLADYFHEQAAVLRGES